MCVCVCVKVLLSFGAGLEYKDSKGLTPLYHTAIMGDGTGQTAS